MLLYMQTPKWSIVFDNQNRSASKRRKAGLDRFDPGEQAPITADFSECLFNTLRERWPQISFDEKEEDIEWCAPFPRNV